METVGALARPATTWQERFTYGVGVTDSRLPRT
jgi:hypothetical protein